MPSRSEILHTVADVIREQLDVPDLVVTEETSAADVAEWDSMNHILIIVGVERAFHIKFATVELEEMRNVGHLVSLIERKVAQAA